MQRRIITSILFSYIIFSFPILGAKAKITLPAFISDNMVLQQQSSDPIWGWAEPGVKITVTGSWNNPSVTTQANKYGEWEVKLKTPKAGGPYTVTIEGEQTITLHNVLIGEVWLASGQSNMEMPVSGWPCCPVLNSKEVIKQAHYPRIRLFNVQRAKAVKPQKNVKGSWSPTTSESVSGFSATAYFFGLRLYKKLHVPIGLIASDWGGTVMEAWTSGSGLRKLGMFDSTLNHLDRMRPRLRELRRKDKKNKIAWKKRIKKIEKAYSKLDFDDSSWEQMQLPVYWENVGYPNLDGIMWYRKTVQIPDSWKNETLELDLGFIDDNDIAWFNGHKIGSTKGWNVSRSYAIPAKFVNLGKNVISVRVVDTGGNGGIYGNKKLLKLYPKNKVVKDSISVSNTWKYKIGAKKPHVQVIRTPNTASVLYNGMISPLIPYHIRGVIWYQGAANVGRAKQYTELFPAMIKDWRNHWNEGLFPFYFVQIAPFRYGGNGKRSAALRDAQRKTLSVPNTGMVVTLDIGDTTLIHPANKEAVGKRLSLWALSHVYGENNVVYSGPLFQKMKVKGNKAIISFTHVDGGLVAKGNQLKGFEVAGRNGHFVSAQALIRDDQVIVHSDKIKHPTAVRYGWQNTAQAYLFNKAGLPASSFSSSN